MILRKQGRLRSLLSVSTTGVMIVGVVLFVGVDSASATSPSPVGLGTADTYGVLGGSTITNTGTTTLTNSDLGLAPGTAVTGQANIDIVNGATHVADAEAVQAKHDLGTAFVDAASRPSTRIGLTELTGAATPFTPGVYSGGALQLTGSITLDGNGEANPVFIFKAYSTLNTAVGSSIVFSNGANACDVFWVVGSSATLAGGSSFAGTVMAATTITVGNSTSVDGRLLAQSGAVNLAANSISRPTGCAARGAVVPSTPTADQVALSNAAGAVTADNATVAAATATLAADNATLVTDQGIAAVDAAAAAAPGASPADIQAATDSAAQVVADQAAVTAASNALGVDNATLASDQAAYTALVASQGTSEAAAQAALTAADSAAIAAAQAADAAGGGSGSSGGAGAGGSSGGTVAAQPRLPVTGVNPVPGLLFASAFFLLGATLMVVARRKGSVVRPQTV